MNTELSRDNPRLVELTQSYSKLNLFEQSVWKQWADGIPIDKFRGEIGYMAQMWSMTPERYQNTLDYALSIGLRHDIEMLGEDGAFGAITFSRDMGANEDDIVFSRDLLDSVVEIDFLRKTLDLKADSMPVIFDIGGGYGRFAHRFLQTFSAARVYVGDGIPLSTFLCEFYLRYRGVVPQARAMPLCEGFSIPTDVDIATNMQSFSEMPLSAVEFWIKSCADSDVPYFFLEPHSADLIHPHFVTSEPHGGNKDYYHLFEKYGYKLKVQQPKFPRDLAPMLIYSTDFLLFERS